MPTKLSITFLTSFTLLCACATDKAQIWAEAAEEAYQNNDLASAITLMEQAMQNDPTTPYYATRFALMLKTQGEFFNQKQDWALAENRYQRAAELLDSQNFSPNSLRNFAKAREMQKMPWHKYAHLLEAAWQADSDMDTLQQLAIGWDQEQNPQKAIPFYQELLTKEPHDHNLKRRLAALHLQAENYDESLQILSTLQEIDPQSPSTLRLLATTYQAKKNLDAAQNTLESLAMLQPERAAPWRELAEFCQQYQRLECADLASTHLEKIEKDTRKLRPLR